MPSRDVTVVTVAYQTLGNVRNNTIKEELRSRHPLNQKELWKNEVEERICQLPGVDQSSVQILGGRASVQKY